jgi:hypothetical protein
MMGLVMSLVAAATPVLPAAGLTCAEGPSSCDLAPLALARPRQEFATPAVIDCRSPLVPIVLSTLVGECTGTPHDASYWTSRYPESEESQTLAPATRGERRGGVAACDGLPQRLPALPLSDAQPLAVVATPSTVLLVATASTVPATLVELPSRLGDPPDRPPRVSRLM